VNTPSILPSERIVPAASEQAGFQAELIPYQGNYLWRTLAILAILALWAEWWLFYSGRINRQALLAQQVYANSGPSAKQPSAAPPEAHHNEALDHDFIT